MTAYNTQYVVYCFYNRNRLLYDHSFSHSNFLSLSLIFCNGGGFSVYRIIVFVVTHFYTMNIFMYISIYYTLASPFRTSLPQLLQPQFTAKFHFFFLNQYVEEYYIINYEGVMSNITLTLISTKKRYAVSVRSIQIYLKNCQKGYYYSHVYIQCNYANGMCYNAMEKGTSGH